MNNIKINPNTELTQKFKVESNKADFKDLAIGDIISGTLTSIEGNKSVITMDNGKTFSVDAKNIIGELGQRLDFKVADTKGNSVVMKQIIEEKKEKEEKQTELEGDELLNWTKGSVLPNTGAAFAHSKIMFENSLQEDRKLIDALNAIKRDISHSMNNVNSSVLSMLAANGISLNNVTMTMLSSAIKTAVSGVSNEPTGEEIINALESYSGGQTEALHNSVKALLSEELPITESNIENLNSVRDKADETGKMSRSQRLDFLMKEQDATINNLFTSMHSSQTGSRQKTLSEKEWNEMSNAVLKYMDKNNIPQTKENLNGAKLLIANSVPVTKENLDFLNEKLKPLDIENILSKSARNISEGKSPFAVNLYKDSDFNPRELFKEYNDIIKALPEISDSAIEATLEKQEPVTINNLLKNENPQQSHHSEQSLSERRKLEEIRLRLTLQSAAQMAKAGISINGMELQEAIDQIKLAENKVFSSALQIAGAEPSENNIRTLSESSYKFKSLRNVEDSVKHNLLHKEIEFTADSIYNANQRALKSYEAAETTVNAKFGDSFRSVEGQVENLLNRLGIEASPDNAKAARSLVKTGTDVTKENIEAIKAINGKIENVSQNLHPLIVAEMIKDGFNPLFAHIDEVISYINQFNEVHGQTPVESMEKAIYNMDKNKELSKEERDSLIAIYRVLSAINKNEAVSSAVISKSEKALTLENLMESGKYFDKSKARKNIIDKQADDSTGEINVNANSIREQIMAAYRNAAGQLPYTEQEVQSIAAENNFGLTSENMELLSALYDEEMDISRFNETQNIRNEVEKFKTSVKNDSSLEYYKGLDKSDLEKTSIDRLLNGMQQFMEENSTDDAARNMSQASSFSVFKEDIQSLKSISPQQLMWMQSLNLPLTVANMKSVIGMSADNGYIGKKFNELSETAKKMSGSELKNIPTPSLNSLNEGKGIGKVLEDIQEEIKDILAEAIDSDSPLKIDLLNQASIAQNASKIAEKSAQADSFTQIPIKLHDKIGSLNIYVLNENTDTENMNAFLQLDTSNLGQIKGSINIKDGKADIVLSCESQSSLDFLSKNSDILEGLFKELGDFSYSLSFKTENDKNYFGTKDVPAVQAQNNSAAESDIDIKL